MAKKITYCGDNKYLFRVSLGYDELSRQRVRSKTVTAKNMREAEKLYALFLAENERTKHISDIVPTLDEFFTYYWKHHVERNNLEAGTKRNISEYYKRVSESLGHLRLDKIDLKKCNEFITQIMTETYMHTKNGVTQERKYSNANLRKKLGMLKTLLSFAYKNEFIADDIASKMAAIPKQNKTKKRIASLEDVEKFLIALEDHKNIKHKLWVYLAFAMGLRREEIFGLQWSDIDLDKKILTLKNAVTTYNQCGIIEKGLKTDNSYRRLAIPNVVIGLLKSYSNEFKAVSKWLFPRKDGISPGNPTAFISFLSAFTARNNLPHINPHQFRHLSGSFKLKHGINIADVSGDLGHSSISFTLDTYIHELEEIKKESANTMDNIIADIRSKTAR